MGKKRNKGGKEARPVEDDGEYKVGTLGSLITQSCGVAEPEFDPVLASLFASADKRSQAVVKRKEFKEEEALPTPPPRVKKERKVKLKHKDAASIRVQAKANVRFSLQEEEEEIGVEPTAAEQKPLKRLGKEKPAKKKKNVKDEEVEVAADQPQKSESNTAEEQETVSEEVSGSGDAASSSSSRKEKKKKEPGEVKKTLREMNAPKDKDPELEQRTLFVGNVPKESTKKQVIRLFKSFGGTIESLRFRCAAPDKPTRLKKVAINRKELHPEVASIAAYIRYATREEAESALEKGKAEGLVLSDHHLVLDMADRSMKRDNKKAIFVGNLPLKVQDDEAWEFFSECGQVESVRIIRDRATGLGKGFGYINFVDRASVELALQKEGVEFKNRQLRISRCVKKLKKSDGVALGSTVQIKEKLKTKKKVSQGLRQRKEVQQFSGDRTAEVGKFKRNSKKPSKEDMHKATFAKKLAPSTGQRIPDKEYKAKKKELRKKNKPRWPRNK